MLYNGMGRRYTRPSKWMDKGSQRKPRMQERDNRWEVMTFSVNLPSFSDERGSMGPVYVADRCSRPQQGWTQPVNKPVSPFDTDRKRAPLFGSEGVNLRAGVGLLLAVMVVMLAVMAVSYGQVIMVNRQANQARERTALIQDACYTLEKEIAESASEINVTISAVGMGMISARGVNVIYLTAPETAVMSNPGTGMLSAEYLGSVFGE